MQVTEPTRKNDHPDVKPVPSMDAHRLIAQLGGEVASTLTSAQERLTRLAASGRIERADLEALRDEIDRARRVAMMGQQASRFASGRVGVAPERLDLTGLLLDAARQRARELECRGLELRQAFAPVEVMLDPALGFSLVQSVLDWAVEHALDRIELKLDIKANPAHARLACSFSHRDIETPGTGAALWQDDFTSVLDSMAWSLLQQTAATLGVLTYRHDTRQRCTLTIEFPNTIAPRIEGLFATELVGDEQQAYNSQPLAGRHVLVVASRREVRNLVREALRPMGVMMDFVNSVEEAATFIRDGLPHAVVYESALAGERFEWLRRDLWFELPTMAFVQLSENGKPFEVLTAEGRQFASVGRESIIESLPAALLYEMASHEE